MSCKLSFEGSQPKKEGRRSVGIEKNKTVNTTNHVIKQS